MGCSFQAIAAYLAIFIFVVEPCARGEELCQTKDERVEFAALAAFFDSTLREHGRQTFSRPLLEQSKSRAKILLEQKILDKKIELCADHLALVEEIKNEPKQWANGDCAAAAVVFRFSAYTLKVAQAFEANQKAIRALHGDHLRQLKLQLYEVAKGTSTGLEGSFAGYALSSAPTNIRFEWIKTQATRLSGEAHRAWGIQNPEKNPLVQNNRAIFREMVRARDERDSMMKQLRTDGKISPSCVRNKP